MNKNKIITSAVYKIYRENNFYKVIARLKQDINCVAFSRHGRYIGVNFDNGTNRLWDLNGKELTDLKGFHVEISFDDSSADGQFKVVRGEEGIVRVWGENRNKSQVLVGHEDRVDSHAFSRMANIFLLPLMIKLPGCGICREINYRFSGVMKAASHLWLFRLMGDIFSPLP